MKTLVVYDSVYGNTETIARTIGRALGDDVAVQRVGEVKPHELKAVDLLVIGSPTRGSLATEAIQGLIEQIGPPACEGASVATFDTRLAWRILERWGGCRAQDGGRPGGKGRGAGSRAGRLYRNGTKERATQAK